MLSVSLRCSTYHRTETRIRYSLVSDYHRTIAQVLPVRNTRFSNVSAFTTYIRHTHLIRVAVVKTASPMRAVSRSAPPGGGSVHEQQRRAWRLRVLLETVHAYGDRLRYHSSAIASLLANIIANQSAAGIPTAHPVSGVRFILMTAGHAPMTLFRYHAPVHTNTPVQTHTHTPLLVS